MEKKKEIEIAKKRRAKYLAEWERTKCTITKLAKKHGVTHSRMSQQLKKAIIDRSKSNAQSCI